MRFHILIVLFAAFAMLLAGCVQPVQKLGCCVKSNATGPGADGCVIYNMTDYEFHDYRSETNGPCDDNDSGTADNCNVSFGDEWHLVPICTEDELGSCFYPDCKAMVCGDFKYTPRVAPGITLEEEDGAVTSDAAGEIPPGTEDENALGFYGMQCRFLDMDTRLRTTMKNSNSKINSFRIGIGTTFEEFDQYRYYFPISDEYCNINPPRAEGDLRVDRYMNYVGPGYEAYLPTIEMDDDCLVDDGDVPPPFRFGYSNYADTINLGTPPYYNYNITAPDRSGYKFKQYARWGVFANALGGFIVNEDTNVRTADFKAIDDDFYRKALSNAYFDNIYGGSGRAPFECDSEGYDCYSGDCDTSFYSRGLMATGDDGDSFADGGCSLETDATGHQKVICFPTKNAYQSGGETVIDYASVFTANWLFNIDLDGYASNDINEDDADPGEIGCCREPWCGGGDYEWNINHVCQLRWEWLDITGKYLYSDAGRSRFGASCGDDCEDLSQGYFKNNDMFYGMQLIDSIPNDFGYTRQDAEDDGTCASGCLKNNDDGRCYCPYFDTGPEYPPAAQIEFFGIFGDNDYEKVIWDDEVVIGYSLARESEFDELYLYDACNLGAHPDDYVHLNLDNPAIPDDYRDGADTVHRLMGAFRPYFEHRIFEMQSDAWEEDSAILDGDLVIGSVPWIIAFKRGSWSGNTFNTDIRFMNEPSNYYLDRNYLNVQTPQYPYNYYGVSPAELRLAYDISHDEYYQALMAREITLLQDGDGDGKFGDCTIDELSGLPKIKTYGWCKPCTISTLAYQFVSTKDDVYMPTNNVEPEDLGGSIMCYTTNAFGTDVTCFDKDIVDLSVYGGKIAYEGSPRTYPEASYMKEKLEVFMRSGIMPVMDLNHDSNWDLEGGPLGFYEDYDNKYLLDNKGAMIVIIDQVSCFEGSICADSFDSDELLTRANSIRNSCPRCLTAIEVRTDDNESLREAMGIIFADPRNKVLMDMVAIAYSPNWGEIGDNPTFTADNPLTRSVQVVQDLSSYSRVVLEEVGKPTLIVKFYVSESLSEVQDGLWNESSFETLFTTVITNQDMLVKSGIIGIVFSPARSEFSLVSDEGLVDETSGIGYKTEKFCALERAANKMTTAPLYATFTPLVQQDNVDCIPCSDLEIALGLCDAPDATRCDSGGQCSHSFDERGTVKCPENTIIRINSAINCPLCADTPGVFTCDYKFVNGSVETQYYNSEDVTSQLYAEVMAGLERPDKCCVVNNEGVYFSYAKTSMPTPLNRPIVFSESGNVAQDCGVTSANAGIADTAFCGYNLPVKQYDINCSFLEGADIADFVDDDDGASGLGGGGGGSGDSDGAPPVFDDIPFPIGDGSDDGADYDDALPIADGRPIWVIPDNDSDGSLPIFDEPPPIVHIPIVDEPPLPFDEPPPDLGG